jgi:hypothetical protein
VGESEEKSAGQDPASSAPDPDDLRKAHVSISRPSEAER